MRSSQSGLKTLRINAAVLQFQVYCEPVTTQYENYIGSESKHATCKWALQQILWEKISQSKDCVCIKVLKVQYKSLKFKEREENGEKPITVFAGKKPWRVDLKEKLKWYDP